jgi:hypothetical protein
MAKRPATTLIVIACVMTLVLTWGVGELHYRNCTQAVEITYGKAPSADVASRKIVRLMHADRYKALDDCSRLPF